MAKVMSKSIHEILEGMIKEMSVAEIKRSTPINGLLPATYNYLLHGAVTKCAKKPNERIECKTIIGPLAEKIKVSDHTETDIARLTSTPHPLLNGRSQVEGSMTSYRQEPLFDEDSGELTSSRYTGFTLTPLGQMVADHYAEVPLKQFKGHLCILPLILYKNNLSFAHGHKAAMLPYNPAELAQLQIDMIEAGSKDIPPEKLSEHFHGPDVGKNYTIFEDEGVSNALQFVAGTGEVTVVPTIEVNIERKYILFIRPPFGTTTKKLIKHLQEKIKKDGQFKTFHVESPTISITEAGSRCIISNVQFFGSEKDVIRELREDKFIVRTFTQHICSLDREGVDLDDIENAGFDLDPNLDDLTGYKLRPLSIQKILWRCIQWERQWQYNTALAEYNKLKDDIDFYLFLEKISRPGVSPIVKEASGAKDEYGNSISHGLIRARWGVLQHRTPEEIVELKKQGVISEDDLIPEGLTDTEINYLFQKQAPRGVSILYALDNGDKVLEGMAAAVARFHELEELLHNESAIYDLIKQQLYLIVGNELYQRQTKVYHITGADTSKKRRSKVIQQIPESQWDNYNLPCSIYYNYTGFARCFGRNMNLPFDIYNPINIPYIPYYELECTTRDILYCFYDGELDTLKATEVPTKGAWGVTLQGIIPKPQTHDILAFTTHYKTLPETNTVYYFDTRYFYVSPEGLPADFHLDKNEMITSWCYIPTEEECTLNGVVQPFYLNLFCVEPMKKMGDKFPQGLVQIPSNTLPEKVYAELDYFSGVYGRIQSCYTQTNSHTTSMNILTPNSDVSKINLNFKKDYGKVPVETSYDTPVFTSNINLYYNIIYIPWWDTTAYTRNEDLPRSKKAVLKEYIWVHNRDEVSNQIYEDIYESLDRVNTDLLYAVQAYKSELNMNYKVSQLEDWSLLDYRFRLPATKPTDLEYLAQCDLQMERIFAHDRFLKPRHLSYAKDYLKLMKSRELEQSLGALDNPYVDGALDGKDNRNKTSIDNVGTLDENDRDIVHSSIQDFIPYESEHSFNDEFNSSSGDVFNVEEEIIVDPEEPLSDE